MSGGRATIGRRKGDLLASQAGDITAIHEDGHALTKRYFVECKFYKSLDLARFWQGQGRLAEFWRKASSEARAHKKVPILIAKQNGTPPIVLVPAGCPIDLPGITCWRSVQRRGGDIAVTWLSTLLHQDPKLL